ncbi:MAG: LamG domain-containing protein [Phycisphaerales bacterium]|jgi:hypothetical protein
MCRKLTNLIVLVFALVFIQADAAKAFNLDDPDLIAYWAFDEGAGTVAADLSGNGYDGTLFDGTTWIEGVYGNALQFDGRDAYVGTGESFLNGVSAFTLAGWVSASNTNAYTSLFGQNDLVEFGFTTENGGQLGTWMFGNNWVFVGADYDFPYPSWHHVALVGGAEGVVIYIDGQVAASDPGTVSSGSSSFAFAIGGNVFNATGNWLLGEIDDVWVFSRALTQEEIIDVMLSASASSEPNPEDGATDVSREVILSWKPAEITYTHDVYFGTVFDDVNDATRNNSLDVLLSQGQDANTYEPARLELGRTYYWRIDEINAPSDNTVFPGEVWSFTVEPFAYAIENITVTASSSDVDKGPENAVNGSGLDESGLLHNNISVNNMWLSSPAGEQPTWIGFEFDDVYKLHEMWVWNSNDSVEPVIGFGIREAVIEYSVDGVEYMTLGTTHEFARAPGLGGYAHNATIDFGGLAVKYVKITANSNWGGILDQYGLSEVRFLYKPVHAREPNPAAGATGVPLDVTLDWRAGREAAEHNVYFSDDQQAVIDGTADITTITDAGFGPLDLDLGKIYYWRIDEVNNAETPGIWEGETWNFTTFEYFVVDDFEDYNDFEPDRIFDMWADGWNIPTNGSTIGYPEPIFTSGEHFVETNVVHSGSQSMPYFYDNSAGNSEATFTLSSRRNWTEKGIGSLTLWFRGNAAGFVEDPAGIYTINATGSDIWGIADEFRYAFKLLSGPGSITAKVESIENTDPWAKAGVMIRQSLDANTKFAAVYITPGSGCRFQGRFNVAVDASSDDTEVTTEQTAITAPYWIRIDRDALDNFRGYYSSDGVNWVEMSWSPQNTAMPTDVYIGLALTSHNTNEACTAVFSNVQTTGAVSPQVWTQQAIGVDMPSNEAVQMYVVLNENVVVYNDNPDASQVDEWTEWNIDLQKFADQGIDLTDVDSLGIGFGDRSNPQLGGAGVVYFDDIRLYPPRPAP